MLPRQKTNYGSAPVAHIRLSTSRVAFAVPMPVAKSQPTLGRQRLSTASIPFDPTYLARRG
jgi:hypothetical protein